MNKLAQNDLIASIARIIEQVRSRLRTTVNSAMTQSYWEIGQLIVEDEQQGNERAEYGKRQLQQFSKELTQHFGKGFDISNLRYMRLFYKAFPICDAVRHELSWTHYRTLLRVETTNARQWYLEEAIGQNWSARALDRQISKLYYERLLASQDKALVEAEAETHTGALQDDIKNYLRDPYILDFRKLGKLKHQDLGQMDTYARLYDAEYKGSDDNPTMGLVLCSETSAAVAKYSVLADQKQLFAAKYLSYLPSEEELSQALQLQRAKAIQQVEEQRERYGSNEYPMVNSND